MRLYQDLDTSLHWNMSLLQGRRHRISTSKTSERSSILALNISRRCSTNQQRRKSLWKLLEVHRPGFRPEKILLLLLPPLLLPSLPPPRLTWLHLTIVRGILDILCRCCRFLAELESQDRSSQQLNSLL